MRSKRILESVVVGAVLACAGGIAAAKEIPIDLIRLPEGFKVSVYAPEVPGARSMARTDKGTLFVGTRGGDHVSAVLDKDGDGTAETVLPIGKGLSSPNGVALKDGSLYVSEISRILRFDDIENKLENPPEPVVVIDTLPDEAMHGWKYLAFGPDGRLYFNIGSPENVCGEERLGDRFATISSIQPDGSDFQVYARGVRNSVGFTWHPTNKQLWFTDNGRDMLGDDRPPCELNHATAPGQHFGFPFCHGGDDPDPDFGKEKGCEGFVPPAQKLLAHVAPLGVKFYTGTQFPAEYQGAILVAEHGSFNRSIPQGYRISMVKVDEQGNATSYGTFADGWLRRTLAWGRPVDLLVLPDGSLLVSDDKAEAIYRISYAGK